MKLKTIFLGFVCLVLFAGCKKDKVVEEKASLPLYYFKFKLDGVQKIYTGYTIAQPGNYLDPKDGTVSTAAFGKAGEPFSEKNVIWFTLITVDRQVVGKNYVNYFTTELNKEKATVLWLSYNDENGEPFTSYGDELSVPYINIKSDGYVKFLEIGKEFMKGVFSAAVYNSDYTKNHKITDGEFYVERSDSNQG